MNGITPLTDAPYSPFCSSPVGSLGLVAGSVYSQNGFSPILTTDKTLINPQAISRHICFA
jgi:hypothetical protein